MTVQALLAGSVPWGWGRSPQLPTTVFSERDQTSTTVEPSSMGTLIPLVVPSGNCSSHPELGLLHWDLSQALCSGSLSPWDARSFPCLPSGLGYRMSQKKHTFPTLLKTAKTVDAVWQAAWQAAPCCFGAV